MKTTKFNEKVHEEIFFQKSMSSGQKTFEGILLKITAFNNIFLKTSLKNFLQKSTVSGNFLKKTPWIFFQKKSKSFEDIFLKNKFNTSNYFFFVKKSLKNFFQKCTVFEIFKIYWKIFSYKNQCFQSFFFLSKRHWRIFFQESTAFGNFLQKKTPWIFFPFKNPRLMAKRYLKTISLKKQFNTFNQFFFVKTSLNNSLSKIPGFCTFSEKIPRFRNYDYWWEGPWKKISLKHPRLLVKRNLKKCF